MLLFVIYPLHQQPLINPGLSFIEVLDAVAFTCNTVEDDIPLAFTKKIGYSWVFRSNDASDFGQTVPLKRSYNYINLNVDYKPEQIQ
jgi:hypothetical protein